ncbi:general transcription factor IIE subunit 2-like [Acanthaster planci]|uniref:Transcription initiation factor IIE subunit beta n=1 Tax=Acanthaster planci TaxID=133434 RepID=A0A8B7XWI9_ACAPL|nr:general transcription factor IIE subunit 2-like [Acanthaster planci]XP_022084621.1 general transcription factor IIE subunit 2-like [Acanthaster planci]XP_022084622.1 general transcription factor IIE subunit 2-like [Acanthaster planci]XP_022084623.1 general transcription factor IIE subunit 2-like [Acanthaster planci]XP_022084625.1 general transcription factor IIE subunit 2-like [Acanthaster planci]
MDAALLKEREAFRKRALAQPVIEKRSKPASSSQQAKRKKPLSAGTHGHGHGSGSTTGGFNYKMMQGSSKYKFGVLAKIVDYMKQRHQEGNTFPLSIEEILDETKQLDIGAKQKMWLINEALPNNPKIGMEDGKYFYKATFVLRSRKSLERLLKKHDQQGLGGIMMDDIQESLPNYEKCIETLGDLVIIITRPDKKKVVFFNDKSAQLNIDEEIKELWNTTAVDSIDEAKIEEHLRKQGIFSMEDLSLKHVPQRKKRAGRRGPRKFKTHNDHLAGVLQDYSQESSKPS